jgi:hypothetical protein
MSNAPGPDTDHGDGIVLLRPSRLARRRAQAGRAFGLAARAMGNPRGDQPRAIRVGRSGAMFANRASVWSIGSAWSAGSILSMASAGSLLSIGSFGSVLSIGATGSILSIGSAGSIGAIGGLGAIGGIGAVGRRAGTIAGVAAMAAALRS